MKQHTFGRLMAGLISVCALTGVAFKLGILQGRLNLHQLRYFTNLSNLLAAACSLWAFARGRKGYGALKGLAVLCVLVTGVVFHTMLAGIMGGFALFSPDWWANELIHTVVPVLMTVDYLCFDPKGQLRSYHPLLWLLAPLCYFAGTVAVARTGLCFPNSPTPYPYPFLDVWALGWGAVLRNVAGMAVGILFLGYLLYILDRIFAKKKVAGVS